MYRRQLVEHTGTHLVAPNYLSTNGQTADEIPIEMLVVPLAICNISAKAADDPDAQVTPDDIAAWITANGAIPDGACVAIRFGWDRFVIGDGFRNADVEGVSIFRVSTSRRCSCSWRRPTSPGLPSTRSR